MLSIQGRLSAGPVRTLAALGLNRCHEQKRNSSLTMQTLNPLVKEVEYAVRGRKIDRSEKESAGVLPVTLFISGPIVIRAGEIEKQLKVSRQSLHERNPFAWLIASISQSGRGCCKESTFVLEFQQHLTK